MLDAIKLEFKEFKDDKSDFQNQIKEVEKEIKKVEKGSKEYFSFLNDETLKEGWVEYI